MTTIKEKILARLLYGIEDLFNLENFEVTRSNAEELLLEHVSSWIDSSESENTEEKFLPAILTFIGPSAGEHQNYYYNILPLSITRDALFPKDRVDARGDIVNIIKELREEASRLGKNPISFLYLIQKYCWAISAKAVLPKGKSSSAYSLYYRQRMIAALTECLDVWANFQGPVTSELIENASSPFLLIYGGLEGTGEFILSSSPNFIDPLEIRGRSFYLECLVKAVSFYILKSLSLSRVCLFDSKMLRFIIIAPNLPSTIDNINKATDTINRWFLSAFSGKLNFTTGLLPWSRKEINSFPNLILHLENLLINNSLQNFKTLLPDVINNDKKESLILGRSFSSLGEKLANAKYLIHQPVSEDIKSSEDLLLFRELNQCFYLTSDHTSINGLDVEDATVYSIGKCDLQVKENAASGFIFTTQHHKNPKSRHVIWDNRRALLATRVKDLNATVSFSPLKAQGACTFGHLTMMIDIFFTAWVSKILPHDVMPVFYGDDTLIVEGPWDQILEFAQKIIRELKDYVGVNENIALSGTVVPINPSEDPAELNKNIEDDLNSIREKGGSYLWVSGHLIKWEGTDYECLNQLISFGRVLENHIRHGLSKDFLYFLLEISQRYNIADANQDFMWFPHILHRMSKDIKDEIYKDLKSILIGDIMDQRILIQRIDIPIKWAVLRTHANETC